MLIRSDIITRATVGAAARTAGVNFIDTGSRDGWYEPIREFKPKAFANGFEVFLAGSSPYAAQHGYGEKAATWDEWGVFIAALYSVDPNARIGPYADRADFIRQTGDEATRVQRWHNPNGYQARTHRAPWLGAVAA